MNYNPVTQLIAKTVEPSTAKRQTFDILNQTPNVKYRTIDGVLYRIEYTPMEFYAESFEQVFG